jgi:hypothetical protein
MKTIKIISLIICLFACTNKSGQSDGSKYLELTESQLREIGFVIIEKGIFFKTEIPTEDSKKLFEVVRGYLNTPDAQGTRYIMGLERPSQEERLKKINNPDFYDSLPPIKCDYYFVKIVEINGGMICDVEPHKTETIPIIVRQSRYNFKIKKDIIVYMKATKGLKEKLGYINNIEQYIFNLKDK